MNVYKTAVDKAREALAEAEVLLDRAVEDIDGADWPGRPPEPATAPQGAPLDAQGVPIDPPKQAASPAPVVSSEPASPITDTGTQPATVAPSGKSSPTSETGAQPPTVEPSGVTSPTSETGALPPSGDAPTDTAESVQADATVDPILVAEAEGLPPAPADVPAV